MTSLSNSNTMYIELAKETRHYPEQVVPYEEDLVSSFKGFRSTYLFPEQTYRKIKESGSLSSLDKFPVYSDTLFVDFDDGKKSLKPFFNFLKDQDVSFSVWFSGSKGYHFHIPIQPMEGINVPHSQKEWVKSLADKADPSIYRHSGLFRLPKTYHERTGEQKSLVYSSEGTRSPRIPLVEKVECKKIDLLKGEDGDFLSGISKIQKCLLEPPSPGERHTKLISICKDLMDAGVSQDTIIELMSKTHQSWETQYDAPEEKIREALDRVIRWVSSGN